MIIEGIDGTHIGKNTDNDVKGFYMTGRSLRVFPKNIERYFPNLEGIWISRTSLAEISKEDLRPLSNLKTLYMRDCYLTRLESGLFQFNPKLQFISLSKNNISVIAADTFDGLEDLQEVELYENACIDMRTNGKDGISKMKRQIKENCQATTGCMEEVSALKSLIKKLEAENEKLKAEIDSLTTF